MIESFKLPVIIPETVSGAICSFNDEYGGLPLKSCVSQISGYQEGSGVPSPSNVRPLHAWSGANITACGVNLWDEEWEEGYYVDGAKANSNDRLRSKNLISVFPNTIYYISAQTPSNYATILQFGISYYDGSGNYLSDVAVYNGSTFITPNNSAFITFFTGGSGRVNHPTYNNDISINYPSTDTSYHAYNGNTYTFTFGTDIYSGSIDWKKGIVIGTYKIVDLGDLEWKYSSATMRFYTDDITDISLDADFTNMLCSYYDAISSAVSFSNMPDKSIKRGVSSAQISIRDLDYTDIDLFTASVTGQKLAYELATPIEIPLGGIQLLTQEGQNNITCDTGDTTLEWLKVN